MNIVNCKVGMKVTSGGKKPAFIDRNKSLTCRQEDQIGYLTVMETTKNKFNLHTAVVKGTTSTVTFYIEDLKPLWKENE